MSFINMMKMVIVLLSLMIGVQGSGIAADDERVEFKSGKDGYFKRGLEYDVYFNNKDGDVFVVENVEIEGFQEIGNKTFLIVKARGFKLSEEEGFILFDAVTAILPERNFTVKTNIKSKKYIAN